MTDDNIKKEKMKKNKVKQKKKKKEEKYKVEMGVEYTIQLLYNRYMGDNQNEFGEINGILKDKSKR
jgi:hypothetical protein